MTLQSSDASPASEVIEPTVIDAASAIIENDTGTIDANPADSSAAEELDANKPLDLLSVVKSAVEPVKEPPASSPAEDSAVAPVVEPAADLEAPAVEDDANLPFHNHPRWKAVLAERDSLRDPAEQYGKISSFMETNGLLPEEVAEGFEIMALLKSSEPESLKQALEWFETRTDALRGMVGATLPADLQERLDEGLIDEDSAAELAQARAAAALGEKRVAATVGRTAETQAAEENAGRVQSMTAAVEGWEARIKASDPDYSKKAAMVETTCRAIVQRTGKVPTNAEEAVALADQALAEVSAQFKSLLPKPRPIVPAPASSSAIVSAAPKTLREAVMLGVSKS